MSASSVVRAVVVDPDVSGRLAIAEVAIPVPERAEALVRVHAISLNRGEVRRASTAKKGWRPGWDLAGVVEKAAVDGSGPKEGSRVVGLLASGAWAEVVAVPTMAVAALPEQVSLAQASTLPVAGLTALHALGKGGNPLGTRVLVTGASGGVGIFAVQLARDAGAHVVGLVRQERHGESVRHAGAHEVVVTGESGDASTATAHGPYDLVLDSVGGATLGAVMGMLGPRGTCVAFGASRGGETTFDLPHFYATGGLTLYGFILFHELAHEPASIGLARLARLIAEGRLTPQIELERPWSEIGEVAQQLLDRRFPGKAVLHVHSTGA